MDQIVTIILSIAALLLTLGILVTIHEYGHFWVARRCGVKVERFSIGFGKPLFHWYRGETEYRIAMLPLGGYVKMLGEQNVEIDDADKHRAFNHKPLYQRAAIVAAGPIANFLLAIVLYWAMFIIGVNGIAPVIGTVAENSTAAHAGLVSGDEIIEVDGASTRTWQEVRLKLLERMGETGQLQLKVTSVDSTLERVATLHIDRWLADTAEPQILQSLGIQRFLPELPDIPVIIGEVIGGGRAEAAGLLTNDLITTANDIPVSEWFEWVDIVQNNAEVDLLITIIRNNKSLSLVITPELNSDTGLGFIGAGVDIPDDLPGFPADMQRTIQYSVFAALPTAIDETWNNIVFVLVSIKKMIIGLISVENLSGPITIAKVAGQTVSYGLEYYINFLAVLSISLGVFNLLPIPVLDGGHLFYYLVEAVIRRPVPERVQALGMQFGILLIAGIMLFAFYNDVNRLIN